MKLFYIIITILGLITGTNVCDAQYNTSKPCMINVNNPSWGEDYNIQERAVFKYSTGSGMCSGVLINQDVGENRVQQYFLTAWHCLDGVNLDQSLNFYFNYQSRNENTSDVPLGNQGLSPTQSNNNTSSDGYRYRHISKIELIQKTEGTDHALCRIIDPIPVHFDLHYAGWLPNFSFGNINYAPYVGIHHASGDIKKISRAHWLEAHNNPVATSCNVVTTVIDVLFGWLGIKTRTEVICNYMDIPHYTVPVWSNGAVEPGSSGSPLFSNSNKIMGVLSWGIGGCVFPVVDNYGKFKNAYNRGEIRDALNPDNRGNANISGIGSRRRNCYESLTLSGHYFPASDYQDENLIVLASNSTITTQGTLTVYGPTPGVGSGQGANFIFKAPTQVTLNPGFTVQSGASVSIIAGEGCNPNQRMRAEPNTYDLIASINIPSYKPLELPENTVADQGIYLNFFPNPSQDVLNINYSLTSFAGTGYIKVYDQLGRLVIEKEITSGVMENKKLEISNLKPGVYMLEVGYDQKSVMHKFIKI